MLCIQPDPSALTAVNQWQQWILNLQLFSVFISRLKPVFFCRKIHHLLTAESLV